MSKLNGGWSPTCLYWTWDRDMKCKYGSEQVPLVASMSALLRDTVHIHGCEHDVIVHLRPRKRIRLCNIWLVDTSCICLRTGGGEETGAAILGHTGLPTVMHGVKVLLPTHQNTTPTSWQT